MYFLVVFFVIIPYIGILIDSASFECYANSTIYDHPSRCISCEYDVIQRLGPEWAWLGQKTKSFDAEREMIRMTGDISSAIDTHPIRYY